MKSNRPSGHTGRSLFILLAALLLSLPVILTAGSAESAQEHGNTAPDLSSVCTFGSSTKDQKKPIKRMLDGDYETKWIQQDKNPGWITIQAPEGQLIGGVYICFDIKSPDWALEKKTGEGQWETVYEGDSTYRQAYAPLEEPAETVRLINRDGKTKMRISELRVYGEGNVPDEVHIWQPTVAEADILFLATHADDELIFFGGGIPTYASEKKMQVVVAYLVNCGARRTNELLDGLWSMGVRNYPVISSFPDKYLKTLTKEYEVMGGKKKVLGWIVDLFRQYRPRVVVTHDPRGEYGHPQHKICSACAEKAYDAAADPEQYPESAEQWGTWQVQKLYLHLGKNNRITMDWDVPLASLDGVTGFDAAVRAFTYHISQHQYSMNVTKTGKRYDNRIFGLERTEVGPDIIGNDFMENITPIATGADILPAGD